MAGYGRESGQKLNEDEVAKIAAFLKSQRLILMVPREATRGLRKFGAVSDEHLEKTTVKMPGRDALPKVAKMSPAEIVKVREHAGIR